MIVALTLSVTETLLLHLDLEPALCFSPALRWAVLGAVRAEPAAWLALKLHLLISACLRLRYYDRIVFAMHRFSKFAHVFAR